MNIDPIRWLKAEADFHRWIEKPKLYPDDKENKLRKSIHIYYRRKYYNLLTPIIHQVFSLLPVDELLENERRYEAEYFDLVEYSVSEEAKSDYDIRFKIAFTSPSEENKRILSGLWVDDEKTIYDFYEKEFSKIAWFILKNSGTVEDAKDIFHDALVILMDKYTWGKLDLDCSLGTYIYSISRNLWMERLRQIKKEYNFKDIVYYRTKEIPIDYYSEEPDIFEMVSKAIESLGDPCKQLLELYYFENHSWETVAYLMKYSSAASARNQKYKCLERVRKLINGT
ncbi:MAG: sigma-70 family RNA polymerase sigma factor [Lutibacter sp.]|nr:sigma-70 family RNA polymerase sigma factor [Lutibacter sp.]